MIIDKAIADFEEYIKLSKGTELVKEAEQEKDRLNSKDSSGY